MNGTLISPRQSIANSERETDPLLKEIQRVLRDSGYHELQHLSLVVRGFEVCLRGTVPSYFQKQLAQEMVRRVPGVSALQNEVTVASK